MKQWELKRWIQVWDCVYSSTYAISPHCCKNQNLLQVLGKMCFFFSWSVRERNLDYRTPLHEKRDDGLSFTGKVKWSWIVRQGRQKPGNLPARVVLHRALGDGCRFHYRHRHISSLLLCCVYKITCKALGCFYAGNGGSSLSQEACFGCSISVVEKGGNEIACY